MKVGDVVELGADASSLLVRTSTSMCVVGITSSVVVVIGLYVVTFS